MYLVAGSIRPEFVRQLFRDIGSHGFMKTVLVPWTVVVLVVVLWARTLRRLVVHVLVVVNVRGTLAATIVVSRSLARVRWT